MYSKKISFPPLILFLLLPFAGRSSDTIFINNLNGIYGIRGQYFDLLEDPGGKLTIKDVAGDYSSRFILNKGDVPKNENVNSAYWLRFTLMAPESLKGDFYFELLDFRIDSYQLFIPFEKGKFLVYKGGDAEPFDKKPIPHKNFVRKIPVPDSVPRTYYVRLKANHPIGIIAVIRRLPEQFNYANTEYFLLAIFYGIVITMALYNLLLYFSIKEKAYLFYVLYVLSIGIYALSQDGLGFQFVWPDYPALNEIVYPVALYAMIFSVLLYARSFLGTRIDLPFFDKGIILFLILRALMVVAGFIFYNPLLHLPLVDLIPMLFIFIAGVVKFRRGYVAARYYLFAFTLLFIGYGLSALSLVKVISDSILTVYSFNFGVVGQMIFFSLALADKIKMLVRENEEVNKLIILQLKEKKELKDRLNKTLEEKVIERTRELEEKNAQLDTFVYKASHDIKGPLRSIIGLTTVGMKDVSDSVGKHYLELILNSTRRLDAILADLLNLTRLKSATIEKSHISFEKLIEEILASFKHHPDYQNIKFYVDVNQSTRFYSDQKLLMSIVQNFVENAIKYRDQDKNESFLKIFVRTDENGASILFEDNGLGLAPESKERIFEMFYKVREDSSGTGLGLHLVKMAIDKLGGTIEVESKEGEGSKFFIQLPA